MQPVPVHGAAASVSLEAPWRWLGAGWRDLWQTPWLSLGYGLVFVCGGALISAGLWMADLSSVIPAAAAGFALLGPLLAMGLYEISRRLETGQRVTLRDVLWPRLAAPVTQVFYFGFILMFAFLVWIRIATLLFALFTAGDYVPLNAFASYVVTSPQGLALVIVGSAIGALIAFAIFAMSAISAPMLLDRNVDVMTAVIASVAAVQRHFRVMLLWAWLIAVFVAVGIATAFLGLVVVFPLLGHATWHAYRELSAAG